MFESIRLYQVIVICISSVMLFQGVKNFVNRESGQTWLKLSVRGIVWGGMVIVALYPDITILVSRALGIEDNFNAVVLTAFIMVFLMLFKLLSAIEKIEQNVSELTRKDALEEAAERMRSIKANKEKMQKEK